MSRSVLLATAAAISLGCATPLFAMGGGGGGGGMGGYGAGSGGGASGADDYATAVRLIHREQYAQAVPYLNHALQDKPRNANVLNYEGYVHRMLGDYPGSLLFYQKALEIDPDHKDAHEYLGELYLLMRDTASANAQLAELTRICTDGCDEKDALTKSIADYQSKAAATSTPAATPATTQQ